MDGTETLMSLGEYREKASSLELEPEYVDGVLVERSLPGKAHSRTIHNIMATLYAQEAKLGIAVWPECNVRVTPTRIRIPDISITAGEVGSDRDLAAPPLVCIEVLSEDDRIRDLLDKLEDYFNFGVQAVWVLDPQRKRAMVYGSPGEMREEKEALRHGAIEVPLSEVFRDA